MPYTAWTKCRQRGGQLRGIGGSYGSGPTVAVYVNDIPFNNSTRATQGYSVPDLDPSDFERIEVLRGPQGFIYGADAGGVVIKIDLLIREYAATLEDYLTRLHMLDFVV